MTLDEAIEHIQDRLCSPMSSECRKEHIQLREWLLELKAYRENKFKTLDELCTYMHDFGEEDG